MIVEVLVGPIGSGKSTYARKRADAGAIVINDDALVTAVHGGNYKAYRPNLKWLYKSIEACIATVALGHGKDVIVDRTMVKPTARRRWVGLADSFEAESAAIVFGSSLYNNPEVFAKRRVESDSRGYSFDYWLEVAQHQLANYRDPTFSEGFTYIRRES